jgi:hypothetical protein
VAADVIDRLTLRQQFDRPVESPGHDVSSQLLHSSVEQCPLTRNAGGAAPGSRELSPPGDRIGTAGEEARRQQQMRVK